MAMKHKFVSAKAPTADPNDIDAGTWNDRHLLDADASVPESGLNPVAQDYAGRSMLAVVAPTGPITFMQSAIWRSRPMYWQPFGNNSTNIATFGISLNPGSPTARGVGTVSYFTSQRRVGYVTPATANANVNARAGSAADRIFIIGSVPRTGGFLQVWRVGTSLYANDARCFFGLLSNSGAYGSMSPSSLTDMIGIGFDAGDTSWSVYCNDSSGVPTKVTLPAGFPCNTNNVDVIEFAMRVAPGAQKVDWQVTNLTTGLVATGSMTTGIPIEIPMQPHLNVTNGPSAAAAGVDLMWMSIETEN